MKFISLLNSGKLTNMLIEVLTKVAGDTGLHPVQKRTTLIELLNKAAKELRKELECTAIYREITVLALPNKVISLPSFVGDLKGLRMHTVDIPFDVHSMIAPRYVANTVGYRYKNWRDLGESPVHTITNVIGPLQLYPAVVETTPVTVMIDAQSNKAARIQENVLVDVLFKSTGNLFGPQIFGIGCLTRNRQYDIVIKDSTGTELATLYNTDTKTRYKIFDVSQVFWGLDSSAGETLIDVLYKVKADFLSRDSDSFYAGDDYDEPWYNLCMYYNFLPMENRLQQAMTHRAAALDFLNSAKESAEGGELKKLSFGRNRFFDLWGRRWPKRDAKYNDSYNR